MECTKLYVVCQKLKEISNDSTTYHDDEEYVLSLWNNGLYFTNSYKNEKDLLNQIDKYLNRKNITTTDKNEIFMLINSNLPNIKEESLCYGDNIYNIQIDIEYVFYDYKYQPIAYFINKENAENYIKNEKSIETLIIQEKDITVKNSDLHLYIK